MKTSERTKEQPQSESDVQNSPPVVGKSKKAGKYIMMSIMLLYYIAWAVLAIVILADPVAGIGWGPYDDKDYTYAINYVTGFIMLLELPSLLYYFAFKAPFRVSKKVSIILVAIGVVISVAGDIAFYILLAEYISQLKLVMKISVVIAQVGLLGLYLMKMIKVKSAKKGFFTKVFVKSRNTWGFIFIGTILLTLCIFGLLEGLFVLIGFIVTWTLVLLGLMIFGKSGGSGSGSVARSQFEIYVGGFNRTLTYYGYDWNSGGDIYRDDVGSYWITKDNGGTFFPQ